LTAEKNKHVSVVVAHISETTKPLFVPLPAVSWLSLKGLKKQENNRIISASLEKTIFLFVLFAARNLSAKATSELLAISA